MLLYKPANDPNFEPDESRLCQFYCMHISFNTIILSMPSSFKWAVSFTLPHQNPLHMPIGCYVQHMPQPSHPP
jgi:hypothetical protein